MLPVRADLGSRSLGTGRTAGPDYFSHKFRSPAVASGQEAARTESGQGWLTPEEGSERGRTPPLSRVCAGREEGMRHDGFQAGSRTPSPNLSPASFTPTRFNVSSILGSGHLPQARLLTLLMLFLDVSSSRQFATELPVSFLHATHAIPREQPLFAH